MIEASSPKPRGRLGRYWLGVNEGDRGLRDVFIRGARVEHDILVRVSVHLVVALELGWDVGHDDGNKAPRLVRGRGVVISNPGGPLRE